MKTATKPESLPFIRVPVCNITRLGTNILAASKSLAEAQEILADILETRRIEEGAFPKTTDPRKLG